VAACDVNRQKGQLFEGSSICYDATVAGAAFIVVAAFFARNSRNKIVEQSGNTQKSIVFQLFGSDECVMLFRNKNIYLYIF